MKIVSHNAFWFQGAPFPSDRPGRADERILASLVEVYLDLRPDVLALQEIQDERTFDLLAERLGMSGRYCGGGELPQYGGATFWQSGAAASDWRDSGFVPQRMWQVIGTAPAEGAPLRICNIHLPSSRHLGAAAAQRCRLEEVGAAIEHGSHPGVLVGDFNEAPGGPVGELLGRQGYLDAAVLTGRADRPTALGGGRGDQMWIHSALRERLVEYGVLCEERSGASRASTESLSDHFPLWVTLTL